MIIKNRRSSIIVNSLVLFSIGLTNLVPPTIVAAESSMIKEENSETTSLDEKTTDTILIDDDSTNLNQDQSSEVINEIEKEEIPEETGNNVDDKTTEVTDEELDTRSDNESLIGIEEESSNDITIIEEKNETSSEAHIEESTKIITKDNELHNSVDEDSELNADSNSTEQTETTVSDQANNNVEKLDVDYYSLEENRDLAIKIMNDEKNKMTISSSTLTHTQLFINQFAPFAQKYANQYGLYPSVMLAQAILESGWGKSSLSQPPYHQMFGIKALGDFSGDYIIVPTKEWVKDEEHEDDGYFITVDQPFRVYSSYDGAFVDQAKFLQKSRYTNVKVTNAPLYTDATRALQSAGYATDPNYADKLNSIIRGYGLDKFDYDKIVEEHNVEYVGKIKSGNSGIYTLPEGIRDAVLYTSYKFNNKDVKVINETITQKNSYYLLEEMNTGRVLGYIEKSDVALYDQVLESRTVNYYATVKSSNNGIFTKPRGMFDSILYTSYLFNNKNVRIGREVVTESGVFSEINRWEDGKFIGWINRNDLTIDSIQTKQDASYYAKVNKNNSGIYTQPEGTEGFILYTSYKYNNKDVEIVSEATTRRGTFVQVKDPSLDVIRGWILKDELTLYDEILSEQDVSYFATVNSNNSGIYTEPHNFRGAILYTNYLYNYRTVEATREITSKEGTFVELLDVNKKRIIGWIKKDDLSRSNVYHQKKVDYYANVKKANSGIYTAPNVLNNSVLYTSYLYNYKDVKAVSEVTIGTNTFVKIQKLDNKENIGWIHKKDLSLYNTFGQRKKVDYVGQVRKDNSGIYTLPEGMYGTVLYTSYKYNEKKVKVVEEAVTSRGVFALIADINTMRVLGWIRKDDVSNKPVVYLDAGHGGADSGASYFNVNEKDVNLSVALKTRRILQANDITVLMSRTDNSNLTLYERAEDANNKNADLFVSIHHNAMPNNSTANGLETYYYKYNPDYPSKINEEFHNDPSRVYKSSILATSIHTNLVEDSGLYDRGVRRQTFAVLRETKMPAALVELGYMSNPTEIKKINSELYQNTFANAIANGILEYLK